MTGRIVVLTDERGSTTEEGEGASSDDYALCFALLTSRARVTLSAGFLLLR